VNTHTEYDVWYKNILFMRRYIKTKWKFLEVSSQGWRRHWYRKLLNSQDEYCVKMENSRYYCICSTSFISKTDFQILLWGCAQNSGGVLTPPYFVILNSLKCVYLHFRPLHKVNFTAFEVNSCFTLSMKLYKEILW
jgi:hypothetical protein